MRRTAAWLGFALAMGALPAAARDAFEGLFEVDGQTSAATRSNAEDFADLFTDAGLSSLFGNYTTVSATTAAVSLRGVPATLSYAAGSTTLRLVVPSAGIDESFTGLTRDESQDLALKWLQGGGGAALTRLLRQAVATTPIDPVAGNPNSLMSLMGAADFGVATGAVPGGRVSFGARFGSYSAEGYGTDVYTLPLGTAFDLGESGTTLVLDVPLTLTSTSASQSYSGSAGLGVRVPIPLGLSGVSWSVLPMLRLGGVGSVDLGAVGAIWSASLTSTLDLTIRQGTRVTIGNMVARLQTLPLKVGDYDVSYELTNQMFRNGVIASQDIGEWFGRPVQASAFFIDTRFTGDELFVSSYQEFGGFLSFGVQARGQRIPLSLGVTVLNGEHGYRGYSVNLGMSF
jgi:hypothetical protein